MKYQLGWQYGDQSDKLTLDTTPAEFESNVVHKFLEDAVFIPERDRWEGKLNPCWTPSARVLWEAERTFGKTKLKEVVGFVKGMADG